MNDKIINLLQKHQNIQLDYNKIIYDIYKDVCKCGNGEVLYDIINIIEI